VIGDMPYGGAPTDTAEFLANPAFISAINADRDVSMVVHVGDIHSGKEYCTQAYDQSIYAQWTAFRVPLIYTPGDNEWADCHKKKEGGGAYNAATGQIDYVMSNGSLVNYAGGDPVANLGLVRSIFFAKPGQSLGAAMAVNSQSMSYDGKFATDAGYVENLWFEKSGVLFATVNMPGGSNNGTNPWYGSPSMSPAQQQEVANRTGAALRWLDAIFARATSNGNRALVITWQADVWDLDGNAMSAQTLTEYKQYIDKLVALSTAFGKPVLMLNGDSHLYRSDNPLSKGFDCRIEVPSATGRRSTATTSCAAAVANGALTGISTIADPYLIVQKMGDPSYVPTYDVPNFHRIVVHGNATASGTDKEYVKLTFDPNANAAASENAFGPFRWTRVQP
jgi:hypothetical protein